MKLNDDETRRLAALAHLLGTEDPRLARRLSRMRLHRLSLAQTVFLLVIATALGVVLVAVGDLAASLPCLVAGIVLTVTMPALAVIWWARRHYCRYCAGKWPTPSGSCPRCERPVTA